jgi:hypothetical protein
MQIHKLFLPGKTEHYYTTIFTNWKNSFSGIHFSSCIYTVLTGHTNDKNLVYLKISQNNHILTLNDDKIF